MPALRIVALMTVVIALAVAGVGPFVGNQNYVENGSANTVTYQNEYIYNFSYDGSLQAAWSGDAQVDSLDGVGIYNGRSASWTAEKLDSTNYEISGTVDPRTSGSGSRVIIPLTSTNQQMYVWFRGGSESSSLYINYDDVNGLAYNGALPGFNDERNWRLKSNETLVRLKVWPVGTPEPDTWDATYDSEQYEPLSAAGPPDPDTYDPEVFTPVLNLKLGQSYNGGAYYDDITIKTPSDPSAGGSSALFREGIRYSDNTGRLPDPEILIYRYSGDSIGGATSPLTDAINWDLVDQTSLNHNDKAFSRLKDGDHYSFVLASEVENRKPSGTVFEAVGLKAKDDDVPISLVLGGWEDATPSTATLTATASGTPTPTPTPTTTDPCADDTPSVAIVPDGNSTRIVYCGEEVDNFSYNVIGPDGRPYNGELNFPDPTSYYEGDLSDSVTGNVSEAEPEDIEVDYSGNYSDPGADDEAAFNGSASAADFLDLSGGSIFGGPTGGSGGGGSGGGSTASQVGGIAILAGVGYLALRRFRPDLLQNVPFLGGGW